MISEPMDVLEQFPVRKSKKQKLAFRQNIHDYLTGLGYDVTEEKGSMGAVNVVIGNPATAQYLVTAHYDTPARMLLPNFITPCNFLVYLIYQLLVLGVMFAAAILGGFIAALITMDQAIAYLVAVACYWIVLILMLFGPANRNNANDNTSGVVTLLEIAKSMPVNYRSRVCFVLFDLEEAGLKGSAAYQKAHKNHTSRQMVLNLDCVGDGDEIVLFPSKKVKIDAAKMATLDRISCDCGEKRLYLHKKGFAFCPSDQANFPYGVGVMAFKRSKLFGIYCDRIHTNRDTNLDITNVNILRAAITSLICQ